MSILSTLVAGDLFQGLESVWLAVRHWVHPVLVLRVRHKVFAQFRHLMIALLRRQLVAHVDLVPDLAAEVAGDDDLLTRLVVLLYGTRQLKPKKNACFQGNLSLLEGVVTFLEIALEVQ